MILSNSFNWYDLLDNPMTLNIFAGIATSLITWGITLAFKRYNDKKKYSIIAGNYEGYGLNDDDSLKEGKQSEATIRYWKENLLHITVTVTKNKLESDKIIIDVWKGVISLDSRNYGDLSWNYTIYDNTTDNYKFGIKKVIIRNIDDKFHILLSEIDQNNQGHIKREVFIPIKTDNSKFWKLTFSTIISLSIQY